MLQNQYILDLSNELIVDNFAGGGGASTGIWMALGRHVDIAINHDPEAVSLHKHNHPQTRHACEDVFNVDPIEITYGRPVGLAWFSPDCKHFSKAKGGKPRNKKIRGLAWLALKWAVITNFRVGILENVEEFQTWGPLLPDGTPDPEEVGRTFRAFVGCLTSGIDANHPDIPEILSVLGKDFPVCKLIQGLDYAVELRELRACDYGAPTIRKRFIMIMRRDRNPIVWPKPTHGDPRAKGFRSSGLKPWRTAAECIDWSLPCHSIFLTKSEARAVGVRRPLADSTLNRIAKGIQKFVIKSKQPFIVNVANSKTTGRGPNVWNIKEPVRTITSSPGFAIVAPYLTEHANGSTQRIFNAQEPLRTQCAETKGGHFALCSAFLAKHFTGVIGTELDTPASTITTKDHQSLVTAHITRFRTGDTGADCDKPLSTVTAGSSEKHPGGNGHALGLVAVALDRQFGQSTGSDPASPMPTITAGGLGKTAEVRAFLVKYYGNEKDGIPVQQPAHTVTTKDRLGLVTVHGEDYQIVDIGMRMLTPRELYRAQGFPEDFIINAPVTINGVTKPLTQEAQVRMCGNSVCPPLAAALVAANVPEMAIKKTISKPSKTKISTSVK